MDLGEDFGIDGELKINRQEFNELCFPLLLRTISIVKRALKNANISVEQINEVIDFWFLLFTFVFLCFTTQKQVY